MASKSPKIPDRPTSVSRKSVDPSSEIQKLRKQNAEVRKKLKSVERERDVYLRATHAYLKLTTTPEEMASGFDGEFIEGSLVGFLKEAKKAYKSKSSKFIAESHRQG